MKVLKSKGVLLYILPSYTITHNELEVQLSLLRMGCGKIKHGINKYAFVKTHLILLVFFFLLSRIVHESFNNSEDDWFGFYKT